MSLYKYVAPSRVDILVNGRIRFTQSSALNDPFEMQPFFQKFALSTKELDEIKNSPDKYLGKIANKLHPALPDDTRARLTKEIYPRLLEKLLSGDEVVDQQMREIVRRDLNESIGILSLTRAPRNLPMWAHYAQGHQGFVIEFDETDSFFNKGPASLPRTDQLVARRLSEECGYLRKVDYFDVRPNHDSILDLTASAVLLAKSKEWDYEQEWRMLQPLEDSDEEIPNTGGNIHLFSIPPSCVRGVILGCQMSDRNKTEISNLIKTDARYLHTRVFLAVVDQKKYALNLVDN